MNSLIVIKMNLENALKLNSMDIFCGYSLILYSKKAELKNGVIFKTQF